MEQQALLQRRERQDVLDLRIMLSSRSISACVSVTSGRSEGVRPPAPGATVAHQRLQRREPGLAPGRAPHASDSSAGAQVQVASAGPLGLVARERIDLERVGDRQIAAAEPHRLGHRPSADPAAANRPR